MSSLIIYSEENFAPLAEAFCGEFESDCNLSAEIVTVDEQEIRRLNKELRGIDSVTDVLSFPSLDGIFGKKILKKDLHFGKRRGMLSKLSGVRARELNISGCGEVWYRA